MSRYPSRFHFFVRHLQQVIARPVLREIEVNLDARARESSFDAQLSGGQDYLTGRVYAFQKSRDIVRSYISGVRIQPEISKRGGTL